MTEGNDAPKVLPGDALVGVDPRAAAEHLERVQHLARVRARDRSDARVRDLDRNIRVWLDREDIATWIAVATAAGHLVDPMPEPAYPHALPPDSGD